MLTMLTILVEHVRIKVLNKHIFDQMMELDEEGYYNSSRGGTCAPNYITIHSITVKVFYSKLQM